MKRISNRVEASQGERKVRNKRSRRGEWREEGNERDFEFVVGLNPKPEGFNSHPTPFFPVV